MKQKSIDQFKFKIVPFSLSAALRTRVLMSTHISAAASRKASWSHLRHHHLKSTQRKAAETAGLHFLVTENTPGWEQQSDGKKKKLNWQFNYFYWRNSKVSNRGKVKKLIFFCTRLLASSLIRKRNQKVHIHLYFLSKTLFQVSFEVR